MIEYKRPLTARMVGTRSRMPNEIAEVLMLEEPQADLAGQCVLGGYLWKGEKLRHLTGVDMKDL